MATDTITHHLARYLDVAGVVRFPNEPGVGARPWLPPIWRQPADGTPEPGTKGGDELDDGLVVAVYRTGGITPAAGVGYSRQLTFDLQYRSKQVPPIEDTADLIRRLLAPAPIGSRYDWQMDGVTVIESRLWSQLQPLGSTTAEGWTFRETYLLEVYASDAV